MRSLLLATVAIYLLFSCKNESSKSETAAAAQGKKVDFNAYPADALSKLQQGTTSIDLISLKKDINVSMSFDNPQAVSIIQSFITDEAGNLTNMCLADAHLVFQENGEITIEADLYYQNGCNALVFKDKQGKDMAANMISNEGVDFFKNFLKNKSTQDTMGIKNK